MIVNTNICNKMFAISVSNVISLTIYFTTAHFNNKKIILVQCKKCGWPTLYSMVNLLLQLVILRMGGESLGENKNKTLCDH